MQVGANAWEGGGPWSVNPVAATPRSSRRKRYCFS